VLSVLLLSAFGTVYPARAQDKSTVHISTEFPNAIARNKFGEDTFKNVKAVHIFVCMQDAEQLPDWLQPTAIVKSTGEYIAQAHHNITYVDGQSHDPDALPCKYDPALEEAGNLNFIIKIIAAQTHLHSAEPFSFVSVERFIYRPDHRTSIFSFLRGKTLFFDLSNPEKARKDFEATSFYWLSGFSDDPEYNK
jgi:hypothetical protein